jgi:CRISPR system Cascade subunit CasA
VSYLRAEIPTATNVNHFRHVFDATQAHCPACAARGLVTLTPFAQSGGAGIKPSINGEPPVYVWLTGRTLFESLALNVILPTYRPQAADVADRPSWRGERIVAAKDERAGAGFVESLTWLPRRVRLLPGEGGRCSLCGCPAEVLVREMVFDQGRSRPKDAAWWRDPFVAYHGARDRSPRALQLREDRTLWRDYAILSLPSVAHTPAAVIEQAAMLAEIGIITEPVRHVIECYGLRTDKAKVIEWRRERLPFSPRLVREPDRAATVERALETAKQIGDLLRQGLRKLYPRDGGGNRRAFEGLIAAARRSYWAALEESFRGLVLGLDDPSSDPEGLEIDWNQKVVETAREAFETGVDSFDADAKALRRAAAARRLFYGRLKKLVAQPAHEIPTQPME